MSPDEPIPGWEEIAAELRSLPRVPLPPRALDAVLARTVGASGPPDRRRRGLWAAVLLTAAAAAVAGILLPRLPGPPPAAAPPSVADAEMVRAAEGVQLAFDLTDRALRRSSRAPLSGSVRAKLASIFERIPLVCTLTDRPLSSNERR